MPIKLGLIGKTNTGKTTFFNSATLSSEEISSYPFTTKSPVSGIAHAITLCVHPEFKIQDNPNNSKCVDGWRYIPIELIDLPGLIKDAWKGKGLGNQFLSIAAQSDALLHVVDAAHPNVEAQVEAVEDTLAELEIDHLPLVIALNKADLLEENSNQTTSLKFDRPAVLVSAVTGQGIDVLLTAIEAAMVQFLYPLHVLLPYKRGELVSMLYERGQVDEEQHREEGIEIYGRLPRRLMPYFEDFRIND